MSCYPILNLCARLNGHKRQQNQLREKCFGFDDWQGLLKLAEKQGMTPLLRKHFKKSGCDFPAHVGRSLNILAKRHQHQAKVRTQVLQEVLGLFQQEGLTPIVIKGAALCGTLYADPSLRPMRDIDILFRIDEADTAQDLLRENGFKQSSSPIPADHYHLPSLHKTIDGVAVCFEIHRGLYPNCPPYYPEVNFDNLFATATAIKIGNTDAWTLNAEETLHYLFQHAFRTPLTYESYKLINVCDIISFTEKYYSVLDWPKIKNDFPLLYNALPLMQHITPWDGTKVSGEITLSRNAAKNVDTRSFTGWPHHRMKEQKVKGRKWYQVLKDTFLPPVWWAKVYYGEKSWQGYLRCVLLKHPRHVSWWKQLYSSMR